VCGLSNRPQIIDCPLQRKKVKRRRLIKLAALSLAGLSLPATWSRPLRADTLFQDIFGHAGFAARLGRLHHANDPAAAARGRALVSDLAAQPVLAREIRLRQHTDADLSALDVVVVDGWVMARTEADLCAAVHLDRRMA
jgi:hypothetical protein